MNLEDLIVKVAPEWRAAFVEFIETGKAQDAFLDHLDQDKSTQDAVELAFSAQSEALEGLALALREREPVVAAAHSAPQPASTQTFDAIARVLENAVQLPSRERTIVLENAMTSASRDMLRVGESQELQDTLSDLKHAVGAAQAVIQR
jgi:hypothetical protein